MQQDAPHKDKALVGVFLSEDGQLGLIMYCTCATKRRELHVKGKT
jgi:hypothetical protein